MVATQQKVMAGHWAVFFWLVSTHQLHIIHDTTEGQELQLCCGMGTRNWHEKKGESTMIAILGMLHANNGQGR